MYPERLNSSQEFQKVKFCIEGLLFGRTREVVQRQGARGRTSGEEETGQSNLTLGTKAGSANQ